MKQSTLAFGLFATMFAACAAADTSPGTAQAPARGSDPLDRTVLPIPEPKAPTITTLDAREAKAPPRFEVKAPEGAPNVVIVLIDDIGFGHSSAFGGPIHMPTLEKLAANGLKYNRFPHHGAVQPDALGAPDRPQPPRQQRRAIMELATAFPGNTGVRPKEITTLAEILRRTGTAPPRSGSTTRRRPGRSRVRTLRPLAHRLGLRQVLRVSSAARRTSGRRRSSTA
jgi:arylsulfatase